MNKTCCTRRITELSLDAEFQSQNFQDMPGKQHEQIKAHRDNTEASTNSVLAQKSGCSRPSGPTAKLPTHLFIQEFEVIILYSAFCNYRIDRGSEDKSGWELPVCICLVLNSPGEREECRSDQLGNYLLTCWRLFSASARLSHTKSHARFWK